MTKQERLMRADYHRRRTAVKASFQAEVATNIARQLYSRQTHLKAARLHARALTAHKLVKDNCSRQEEAFHAQYITYHKNEAHK